MNFLAHLHLAHLADSSLPGNLLADFVRGNPQGEYPEDVVDGIYMHRRIDVMTDNLAEVKTAREWFRPETRRVERVLLELRLSDGLPVEVLTATEQQRLSGLAERGLIETDPDRVRLTDFPLDPHLQVTGLTPDPLPAPLLRAAQNVLALLRKEPS